MNKEDSIKIIQDKIHKWILDHGGYWPPLSMLAAIIEELGELAREINHLEGKKTKKETIKDSREFLSEELGDLLFSIICVANYYEIDLFMSFEKILQKYTIRDSNRFK